MSLGRSKELLATTSRAEIIGVPVKRRPVLGRVRVDFHPADGVDRHRLPVTRGLVVTMPTSVILSHIPAASTVI
jgi:hypothetical protein